MSAVPRWIVVWFVVSGLLQSFDLAFITLRPRSLASANGDLASLFDFHNRIYLGLDPSYGDVNATAPLAQVYMNSIESLLALYAIVFLAGARRFAVLGVVAAMSFWKTVSYFSFAGLHSWADFQNPDFVMYLAAPTSLWIIFPPLVLLRCLREIDRLSSNSKTKRN